MTGNKTVLPMYWMHPPTALECLHALRVGSWKTCFREDPSEFHVHHDRPDPTLGAPEILVPWLQSLGKDSPTGFN